LTEGLSPEQVQQLRHILKDIVREGINEAMEDIGFRLDSDHKEETQETVRFMFGLRRMWNKAAGHIGSAVLTAITAIAFAVIGAGIWAWLGKGGQ